MLTPWEVDDREDCSCGLSALLDALADGDPAVVVTRDGVEGTLEHNHYGASNPGYSVVPLLSGRPGQRTDKGDHPGRPVGAAGRGRGGPGVIDPVELELRRAIREGLERWTYAFAKAVEADADAEPHMRGTCLDLAAWDIADCLGPTLRGMVAAKGGIW